MNSVLPTTINHIIETIKRTIPQDLRLYLVGGTVRDGLLKRATHDLDFVQSHHVVETGRRVANALNGDFYILDSERNTVRVIFTDTENIRFFLDFAQFRGPDLISDLHHRDFTINAMARNIQDPVKIIDPLNGILDLNSGILRTCSDTTFKDDPIRILRCVRFAVETKFQILPDTKLLIRDSLAELEQVTKERMRDELFRIIEGPNPALALSLLDILGALVKILPDLQVLKAAPKKPINNLNLWEHTLATVKSINSILDILSVDFNPETSANWAAGLISLRLGRYRSDIQKHFADTISPERSIRGLLLLACLYHNIGESNLFEMNTSERTRIDTTNIALEANLRNRARELRLSNSEIERLALIVKNYAQLFLLAKSDPPLSRHSIYHYFRENGPVGVDICFLALADKFAMYGSAFDQDVWVRLLDTIRELLEAWWEKHGDVISPILFISGKDLINNFNLEPGPQIGLLLEAVREAQATRDVENREEALAFAKSLLIGHQK